jgi:YD repeat-containing protein
MSRRAVRFLIACAGAGALVGSSSNARASLTSSEQGQIVSYVAEGHVATAARVRALIARPDLTIDESASALAAALSPVAFQEQRLAYVHEMLDGQASLPSRGVVAVALTRALAARAEAVLSKHEADLDQDEAARAELLRIFGFIDSDIANAGQTHGASHDPNAGIGAQSYDDAAKALATVIEHHARWLKGDATIPAAAEPVRAQLQLAIFDMTNDTTTRRFDVADRLWLTGSRRAPLTELGILVLDDGHSDPARIDARRALLGRLPGARENVEAVSLIELTAPLHARGEILAVRADASRAAPFGEDVSAPPVSPEVLGLSRALAAVIVKRAFDVRPELRAQAEADAAAAAGDPAKSLGVPVDPSATGAMTTAVQLLALDAPRAVEVAMVRSIAGHSEAAAILSDAIGAMAVFTPPTPGGMSIAFGHAADDGAMSTIDATNVRLSPAGFATSFTLAGHSWSFTRDDSGRVTARRDASPVTLAMLDHARAPVGMGSVFSGGGIVFAKMTGAPRAGVSAGGRVRVVGDGAIGTASPGDDVAVDATVDVHGDTALVVRAISTASGFKGVGLVLDATTGTTRASLRAWDDAGKSIELAPPVDLPAASHVVVRVAVKGDKLEAHAGTLVLRADVPAGFAHGDVAIAVKHGASFEANGWSVKRP